MQGQIQGCMAEPINESCVIKYAKLIPAWLMDASITLRQTGGGPLMCSSDHLPVCSGINGLKGSVT